VNKDINAILLIAGDGGCLSRLKKTAQDLSVSGKIRFFRGADGYAHSFECIRCFCSFL